MRKSLFLIFLMVPLLLSAQARKRPRTAIVGVVLDAETNTPLEYATVIAYRVKDSVKVGGTATNERGRFVLKNLKFGKYYLNVDFIGYRRKSIKVVLSREKPFVRLGKIYLKPAVIASKPVEVKAKAPALTFKIDKKVINVSRELTSTSGTAVDALKNAPSVEVDIEGNVKLRGSSNFTLLIDGRPTLADPSEVLQQLPAAMIDKIEIITNPSAKYDPEGEAGIINIILKKNRKRNTGFTLSGNAGSFNNYGLNVLLTQRKRRFDLYASFGFGHRNYPGDYTTERAIYLPADTLWIRSNGTTQFTMKPLYFRGGINLKISPSDVLTLGGSFSKWQMERGINAIFEAGTRTREDFQRKHPHYGAFFSFEHNFGSRVHRLNFDLSFSRGHSSGSSYYTEWDSSGTVLDGREVPSTGNGWRLDSRINYKRPIWSGKFEAGYQGHYRKNNTNTESYVYNPDSGRFEYLSAQSYRDDESRHALYALFSSTHGRMGYKLGLRGEYAYRTVTDALTGEKDSFKEFNYFPSLHVSLDLGAARELMASYSRRIRRPRGWMMGHFKTWIDPHTIMMGNPSLKSEYIDSYELGVKFPIPEGLISADVYHKTIHNNIERVSQPDSQNIFIETFKNTGNAYRTGIELLLNWSPIAFLDLNWSLDMFRYQATGLERGNNESFSWSARLTSDIKLGPGTGIEVLYRYRSPVSTSQGKREGFYIVNLGLREKITRNISLTLQVRNLTGSFRWESESEGENFYSKRAYTRTSRMISLNVQYNFNTYRHRKQQQGEENIEWEEFY